MSTRHHLNIGIGTIALLLAVSVGFVFNSMGDKKEDQARIDLAMSQEAHFKDITHQVEALNEAGNLVLVRKARQALGESILIFDQNLALLLNGGTLTNLDGKEIQLPGAKNDLAKTELTRVADLWVQTGLPLADMAAGQFSIFSSAGQNAVTGLNDNGSDLNSHMAEAATGMRAEVKTRQARGNLARWFSIGLTAAFVGLGIFRLKPAAKATNQSTKNTVVNKSMTPVENESNEMDETEIPTTAPAPTAGQVWEQHPHKPFTSPVDFDNVNASVDQLSVDMNTIATSTNKMGVAIDSVGHAMQGMLFSLQQMAQDTGEGYKIVRGANNAATYTKNTAGDLAESAQEMSRVVARVTQLAMKTKQVAGQIESEAVSTGSTGEAFTSVVAGEVQGLAQQTSQATMGIEQTVAEILGTARQYEEAIGQILKNISGINKVSESFGEMMLHPPAAGLAGTPLAANAPMPLTPQPEAEILAPAAIEEPAFGSEPIKADIDDEMLGMPEPASAPDPLAGIPKPVIPQPVARPYVKPIAGSWLHSDDPIEPEPSVEDVAEETTEAINNTAADPEPIEDDDDAVFMLSDASEEPAGEAEPEEEPQELPVEDPVEEPVAEEPVVEEPAAEEPVAEEPEPVEDEDDGSNIFMLNKPQKDPEAKPEEAPEALDPEPEVEAEMEVEAEVEEPVTVPAEPEAKEDKEEEVSSNIFMLNKPK